MGLFRRKEPHLEHEVYKELEKLRTRMKNGESLTRQDMLRPLHHIQDLHDSELQEIKTLKETARKNIQLRQSKWGSPKSWGENVREVEQHLDTIIHVKGTLVKKLMQAEKPDSTVDKFMALTRRLYHLFKKMEKKSSYSTYRKFEREILEPLRAAVERAKIYHHKETKKL